MSMAAAPPAFYELILLLKTSFLALLKMLVAPIIFFSLIGGLLSIGDAARLKTLGSITISYYVCTTAIAPWNCTTRPSSRKPTMRATIASQPAASAS